MAPGHISSLLESGDGAVEGVDLLIEVWAPVSHDGEEAGADQGSKVHLS